MSPFRDEVIDAIARLTDAHLSRDPAAIERARKEYRRALYKGAPLTGVGRYLRRWLRKQKQAKAATSVG